MTWSWLLLAGVGQPLAMELHRWAPLLAADDPVLARLLVREVTLAGPVLVLFALAVSPVKYETRACNRIRFWSPFAALGLLILVLHVTGFERNFPYRVAYLAQQLLLICSWWCAVVGERPRVRIDHHARLAGLMFACGGVLLCLLTKFILGWSTLSGTVPGYDPFSDTPSEAGALGIHWVTWTLVLGSIASIPALFWLDRSIWLSARRFQARLLRIGR